MPSNIREVLTARYEYVVAEKEIVPDLTDTVRECNTCDKWCPPYVPRPRPLLLRSPLTCSPSPVFASPRLASPHLPLSAPPSRTTSPESVRCDRCKGFFHMSCVQPPLISKPTRGYGWTCAPCARAHEKAVAGHDARPPAPAPKPKSHAPPARGRGRPRKDRSLAEKEESVEVKHFKMWPFRYFGCVASRSLASPVTLPSLTRWGPQAVHRRGRHARSVNGVLMLVGRGFGELGC